MADSTLPTSPPSKFDGEHYWDFVTFLVEENLFRLPKYRFLEESEHFCNEYISKEDDLDRGLSEIRKESEVANIDANLDSSPISSSNQRDPVVQHDSVVKLQGVEVDDFRCFLKVLYPRNGEHELTTFTPEQWKSVLKLSTKWFFNDIRHRAIREIDGIEGSMSDVHRIVAAKEHGISEWLSAGYKALVTREETIDLEDGEKIGLRNALQLYQLRDKYHRQGWDEATLKSEIKWKFAAEIDEMQSTERNYFTKAERRAFEEAKAREAERRKAGERDRLSAKYLAEQETAQRIAIEQCERGLELKRQEIAEMEQKKEKLEAARLEAKKAKKFLKARRKAKMLAAAASISEAF